MRPHIAKSSSLLGVLWPLSSLPRAARAVLLAFAGAGLMTVAAKISVPFWPVPMTLQTLAVALIGLTFGPRLAAGAIAVYLAQGAMGLPVFVGTPAQGLGVAYMAGPTGGYLLGFLVAAWVIGTLARRGWDRSVVTAFAAILAGEVAIFGLGLAWLAILIGPAKAIDAGLLPFLPAEALKATIAALAVPAAWRLVRRR